MVHQETIRIKGVPIQCDAVRVDQQTFIISGRFTRTASLRKDKEEWMQDVRDPERVIQALRTVPVKVDLLRFWQRIPETEPKFRYYKEWRHVAAIPITTYKTWFEKQISPKARNKIRKTAKYGVSIQESALNDELVHGIMQIFNQSPVRRGKRFWHYGKDFETVKSEMSLDLDQSLFVTAYHGNELIGFIKLLLADRYALVTLILDKMGHREKAPMNGMIAKAVEICAARGLPHLVYYMWRRGGHADFQESTGFQKIPIAEYFVPITLKGAVTLRARLHRGIRGLIPDKAMTGLLALRAKYYASNYGGSLVQQQ